MIFISVSRVMHCAAGLGIACMLQPFALSGQAFQFQQTSTTIIKTTAQSPAHWYLEIDNLCGVDTLLRWKADLSGIPPGWTITFDDQNNYYTNVQHGDSADFNLHDSLPFPQKLIIGAFTNNIAATASAFFDVYNPADTAAPVLLEYQFVITQAVGIASMQPEPEPLRLLNGQLYFSLPGNIKYSIVAANGQQVSSGKTNGEPVDVGGFPVGTYLVQFSDGRESFSRKLFLGIAE